LSLPNSAPNSAQPAAGASVAPIPATQVAANQPPAAFEKPGLAMQGFCAVTVINENRWVEGKPEYGVIHLGKLYLFSSQQAMGSFLADPAPFTPVLNEIDVVRFFEERKIVKGKREFGVLDPVHNRMFFFADEAALKHFENEYERYTDAALEVMATAIKEANPGT
jgi:YHS domain-containing protein